MIVGALVGSILFLYGCSLIFSMFCALVRFLVDVRKWKDREEPVHITPSQFEADLFEIVDDKPREEVTEDVGEHSEHHTPIIF